MSRIIIRRQVFKHASSGGGGGPVTWILTVQITNAGSGNVTAYVSGNPVGINADFTDGVLSSAPGSDSAVYNDNDVVTLVGTGASGDTLGGWSAAGSGIAPADRVVTMTANSLVQVNFTIKQYSLTVTASGYGSGQVVSTPAGINATVTVGSIPATSANFDRNTNVSLQFTPAANHSWISWSGAGGSLANPNVVAMGTANKAAVVTGGDDIDVLVVAIGTTPLGFYDYRYEKTLSSTSVDAWGSSRYPSIGNLTSTTTLRPIDDGTTINFDGADDVLYSALTANLNLVNVPDITIIYVGAISGSGNRPMVAIQNVDTATRRVAVRTNSAGTFGAGNSLDSVATVNAISTIASGTTVRLSVVGSRTSTRLIQIRTYGAAAPVTAVPTGTFSSENYRLILGASTILGGLPSSAKMRAIIVVPALLTVTDGALWTALVNWSATYHGAT